MIGDEEWDDGNEQNVLEAAEQDNETTAIKQNDEEEEEEEELQRAFSRQSEDYLQDGRSTSVQGPDLDNQNSLDSEALGTGSSSWHSEDGGPNSRRGGETPSSCATPTSASFPSEPEVDADVGVNPDGNNPTAPYPCQFCDRTFPRLSYLKKHEQSHGDQMPYRCSWCNRLFKHKRSRDRHVKLHTGDRRYRCSKCEAAFSRSDHLKIHLKTHDTQRPYQCTACTRGYSSAAALTSHMQSHKKHHQSSSSHSVNKLQDVDYGRRSVSSHSTSSPPVPSSPSPSLNLSMNPRNVLKTSQGTGSTSTTPVLNSSLKLTCMYCTRDSFSCMQQLQIHVRTMHQAILSGAEGLARPPSPNKTLNEQQMMFCSRDKLPERQDDLKDSCSNQKYPPEERVDRPASERDHYENAFTCNQCTMKFSTLACLRDHSLSIHRVDGGFSATMVICPLCGIPCTSTAAYAEHYVLQHCENHRPVLTTGLDYNEKLNGIYDSTSARDSKTRNRDVPEATDLTNKHSILSSANAASGYTADTLLCGQCDAALKDFESFREHVARHLQADHCNQEISNRQHPCPKCETVFPTREDMLAHLTKHYQGQINKEFVCDACKKFYPHPDQLQKHLLDTHAHHLYRCALCRDTFDSKVAIQVHFAVKHSQECRIYRCSVCTLSNNKNSPSGANGMPGNIFRSEAEMAAHVRNVHAPAAIAPSLMNNSPATTRSPVSTPGVVATRCVFCGTCYSSELELQLHLASHSANLYRCPICREGFAVEFLLDRHVTQVHHQTQDHQAPSTRNRENGRIHRPARSQEETKSLKRGRSPASSNNNSLNQRDNNNKRSNYSTNSGQQCDLCERGEFANEAELQAHKKLAHTPSKLSNKALSTLSMTCGYCGEVCRSRSELESHTRVQHASNEPGGRHKCNICDEVCPSGVSLAEHKLQKHCKIQLSDTCVVCRGCLTSENQFLDHVQRHSLENVDPQQRLDNTLPHLPAPCVVCRQTLISDLECRLHARHHLRTSSGSRSAGSSPISLGNKIQSQGCCLCMRDFAAEDFVNLPPNPASTSGQLLRVCKPCYMRHSQGLPILNSTTYEHRAKYEATWLARKDDQWDESKDKWQQEKGFKIEDRSRNEGISNKKRCKECGVKFEDPEEAEKHRITEHEKSTSGSSNTYTCIQCQVSFSTEAKIQQHVRKEHLEVSGKASSEALRCHLCLFEAASPMQLQIHLIEHTFAGCAALSCYICQSLFTTPIGLQNHILQEHGLDARPYDCSKCTLKFFFSAELDHHVLTFHRLGERVHSSSIKNDHETKNESEKRNCGITVKKEVMQQNSKEEEEEEEVNVDDQVGQRQHDKVVQEEQKLKTEIDSETVSGRTES
ncbi:zinc finger protein 423 homolog isoform X2 [Monomorium pharaonis]|uniref:zinc finger protein 423 homolog isoform X2 n=1 Tax=Monomorium pharaonis TaxID=307658 RepID=UPI001747644E|nr:zinc finger protein 423 homolog isoform X2 [Monomorium pharaonis]